MVKGDVSIRSTASAYHYQYHSPENFGGGNGTGGGLLKGPRKVACFCLLAVILPCVLVSVALLMRFVVHGNYSYHLSPSDMRIMDHRISTTWCQGETVRGNTSFTAYMTEGEPELVPDTQPHIIERNLIVPDDHKEYWGFYLLKGSTFRIHTCARWKGGTLLIVRGRSHLEHCAYIGEADSAGDSDQFSASDSGEGIRPNNNNGKEGTDGPLYNSKEEISVILTKIRQYIRSRPKNYEKLKKNLADWMLLEAGRSQEELEKSNGSFSRNSSEILLQMESSLMSKNSSEINMAMEQGTLRRGRRQTEVRKRSESGENGAFEVENNSLEENEIIPDEKVKEIPKVNSIWETEHNHHRGLLNMTTDGNDGSNSESESSWSSSEEAMAKCEGVLASFNILPNVTCGLDTEDNTGVFPYYEGRVNVSGYYYFIFGSENEKRDNLIRARFELEKFVYHLPEPMENCTGVRECRVNFQFASSQKLVITVPQPPPERESVWDEVYIAESECEPRTSLYLIFVLTVPLVILLCAFQ